MTFKFRSDGIGVTNISELILIVKNWSSEKRR